MIGTRATTFHLTRSKVAFQKNRRARNMRSNLYSFRWCVCVFAIALTVTHALRAPAFPLVVNNPFFSIWSPSDLLSNSWPSNGPTGTIQALCSMIRIDNGTALRVMGVQGSTDTFPQTGVVVHNCVVSCHRVCATCTRGRANACRFAVSTCIASVCMHSTAGASTVDCV
jgi:hypothetical protein